MGVAKRILAAGAVAAAAATAGCDNKGDPKAPSPMSQNPMICGNPNMAVEPDTGMERYGNAYDVLSQFAFTDVANNDVSITALKTVWNEQPTTLHFGFAACTEYCPKTNAALAALDEVNPKLRHVVISVDSRDNASPAAREAFMKTIRAQGVKGEVMILFPKDMKQLGELGVKIGVISNKSDPLRHSARVILYAPDGTPLKTKLGTHAPEEFVAEWGTAVGAAKRVERAR